MDPSSLEFLLYYSQTLAFLFVAVAGFWFVLNQRNEHKTKKLRATMEFLSSYTRDMILPRESAYAIPPEKFISDELNINFGTKREQKEFYRHKAEILEFMNSYEFISLNIQKGIIDEELTKDFMKGNFLNAFKLLHRHIILIRESTGNPNLYAEFEAVSRRWEID